MTTVEKWQIKWPKQMLCVVVKIYCTKALTVSKRSRAMLTSNYGEKNEQSNSADLCEGELFASGLESGDP